MLTTTISIFVFDAVSQDDRTSNAVMKHTLLKKHELNPAPKNIYIR